MGIANLVFGSKGVKPISTNNSGTLNTAGGPIRATQFDKGAVAKKRGEIARSIGDMDVYTNVKDPNTGKMVSQKNVIKTEKIVDIMARIAKKHAGETYSSVATKMKKDRKFDYRDKDGKVIEVKFGSKWGEIEKRKKFIKKFVGDEGPTKDELVFEQKKLDRRKRTNVILSNEDRSKADEIKASRAEKGNQDSRRKDRMKKALVSGAADGYKTNMADIGVERQGGAVSVNASKAQGEKSIASVGSSSGQENAASIASAIGTKQLEKNQATSEEDSNVVDMFESVITKQREDAKTAIEQNEQEARKAKKDIQDGEADDYEKRKVA